MSGDAEQADAQLAEALVVLRRGGVIAHACEGVWGFACDAFAQASVERILGIKDRPVDKGLIVIGGGAEVFEPELAQLEADERREVLASWPGAETWIVPTGRFPPWITGAHATVAIRVPGHEQALRLARQFGAALVSTSANLAGQPSLVEQADVVRTFSDLVDFVLPGHVANAGAASRIRVAGAGTVIRDGALSQ